MIARRAFLFAPGLLLPPDTPVEGLARRYEQATGGRLGLFAADGAGREVVWRADERFLMCSTFKASLAGLVLQRAQSGAIDLERRVEIRPDMLLSYAPAARANLARGWMSVREMCAAAVEVSDNTCAERLLELVGGGPALTLFWRSLGDGVSRLDRGEPDLNHRAPGDLDTTSPRAMSGTLRALLRGGALGSHSADTLEGWMLRCTTGERRLRAGLQGWRVADKTGNNGADAAGDIALASRSGAPTLIISAYVEGGRPAPEAIDALFSDIGRALGARFQPQGS